MSGAVKVRSDGEEERIGGVYVVPTHPSTEVVWSRIGNSLLGRLIGICCPRDKEIICGIMDLASHNGAWGLQGWGWPRWNGSPAACGSERTQTCLSALRLHGAGLEKGKSVTVCEISGTKDASVTRKNLLWEQSCRSVIAH